MSGQWHPDTEALADYRAGLIGGFRRRRLAAHVAGCAQCASVSEQLDAVGPMLASVPAPAVPDEVERRIAAALAAEATARQAEGTGTARQGVAPPAGRRRHRRPSAAPEPSGRPGSGRRRAGPPRRFRPVMTLVPVAACLLLAGFGYLLSNIGGSSGPGRAVSAASASSAPAERAAPALPAEGSGAAGSVPRESPTAAGLEPANGTRAGFVVITSGTMYHRATLDTQVRHQMALQAASRSAAGEPAASGGYAPYQTLVGCVLQLTGGASPSFVDRATYQGKPAYVIAVTTRAWVVGLGCTASNPEQITSISLAGPG